jgi:hypothetical protein
MEKSEKDLRERRQNYAERLRTAVKRAHDPLFTILEPEDGEDVNQQRSRTEPPPPRRGR